MPVQIVESVRKLLLVGIPVFLVPYSTEQLSVGLIVCFGTTMIYQWYKPYRDKTDNYLQMSGQVLCRHLPNSTVLLIGVLGRWASFAHCSPRSS